MFSRLPSRIEYGISVFSEHDFYWGIISREEMRSFLALAEKVGFRQARREFTFSLSKFGYADDFSRADFHFMLPLRRNAVILDLGSGYGNITIPLAKYYGKVVAADVSLEHLKFLKLRAESEKVFNIDYMKISPLEYGDLPFQEKSFDAIVVSGVLEWVGSAKKDENPRRLQEKTLRLLAGLVKEDGFLYLAIENRIFPGWLLRDPHSKLPYTTILPRFLADWYARLKGLKDGYRTYIYSLRGYKKLLKTVGLGELKFLYPYANYRSPSFIFSDEREIDAFLFQQDYLRNIFTPKWRLLLKVLKLVGLDRAFLSSFMIIARKKPDRNIPSLLRMAELGGMVEIKKDDVLMKIKNDDNAGPHAYFYIFRKGSSKPYGMLRVSRNPPSQTKNPVPELYLLQ